MGWSGAQDAPADGGRVPAEAAPVLRQPERPAWQVDLTDALSLVEASGDAPLEAVMSAGSVPYAKAVSRAGQAPFVPVPDRRYWWRGEVAMPEGAAADRALVLEFDEIRLIDGIWLNGKPVRIGSANYGSEWSSGEGSVLLPVDPSFQKATLVFRSGWLRQIYENGFGRVRLRPATLRETISLAKPAVPGGSAVLKNLGAFPISLKATAQRLDYFGTVLGTRETEISLEPSGTSVLPAPASSGGDIWKARYSLSASGSEPVEYWGYPSANRENWHRPEVVVLDKGWEYAVVSGPHGPTPPAEGWKPAAFPHQLPGPEWNSHWMWYRCKITIPDSWGGRLARLWLPMAREHARVYINGRKAAEKFSWELPDLIPLPGAPGSTCEVTMAVTDYIVGLSKGVTVPAGGDADLPLRGLSAPITKAPPGLIMTPELLGVPPVHTAQAILRTKTSGGPALEGKLRLENSGKSAATVTPVVSLLAAGTELSRAKGKAVVIPAGKAIEVALPGPDCSGVRIWDLDTPNLHEVRIELQDAGGQVLDTSRERVGFREISVAGDHFTINGRRANLNGGSHVVIDPSVTWPVQALPYRIYRFYYPGPPSLFSGRFRASLGDELGFLLKAEVPGHDAVHQSKYDYQQPEIWERTFARVLAMWRELGNHASVGLWDVGNELWFGMAGEDEKMAALYKRIEAVDPTRLVVNGGGYPNWIPGARVQDWHGWPNYDTRRDWFFYHPQDRPDYQRHAGVFIRGVEGESGWTLHSRGAVPADPPDLVSLGNPPILFSEGHYYENGFRDDLCGTSARVPLPGTSKLSGYAQDLGLHALNWLASRRITVQNARVSGFPGNMIHVNRGVGRWIQPLAAFSQDRKMRATSGGRYQSRFFVMNDMTLDQTISARWTLWDGSRRVSSQDFQGPVAAGAFAVVDLDLAVPDVEQNSSLRLHVEVWSDQVKACFTDDLPVTVFAPLRLAEGGKTVQLFDPRGLTAPQLKSLGIPFEAVEKLSSWKPAAGSFLLIGTEALKDQDPAGLSALGDAVRDGGEVVVLDHETVPAFLHTKLVSKPNRTAVMKLQTPESPVVSGLVESDLAFWQTRQSDWISSVSSMEVPASGMFQTIAEASKGASLLEVQEGAGRVLFSGMNLRDALGVDPAAQRLLLNLLAWPSKPRAFPLAATLIVAENANWLRSLRGRLGVEGTVTAAPDAGAIDAARLIIMPGTDAVARAALDACKPAVEAFLAKGGTLFIQNLDEAGAEWLSSFSGTEVGVEPYGMDRAYPLSPSRILRGLDGSNFFWGSSPAGRDITKPLPPEKEFTGHVRITGKGATPLMAPSYVAEIPVGSGRIVISTLRSMDYPVRKPLIALSTILANAGARLTYGGIASKSGPAVKWDFQPVDLSAYANHPLADDPAGRRGWHMGGDDNDMRMFPKGRQMLSGVEYVLTDPDQHGGNGVIAVAGTKGKGQMPSEVKGIKVDTKAERLYFLHNSAWGVPGFTYRVYYKEDRAKWIPGQPDPFVDVEVRPGENIADWWGVDAYERGDAVLNGATLAWSGQNPRAKAYDRKVGAFQMAWDNPHPEKTIESIDILSPGRVGDGQAFIFGISAANKKTEP